MASAAKKIEEKHPTKVGMFVSGAFCFILTAANIKYGWGMSLVHPAISSGRNDSVGSGSDFNSVCLDSSDNLKKK